jgi:hypothetical protein
MYCDANGRPDPNGDYELINGSVCVRDGRGIVFNRMFMDSASGLNLRDAKSDPPKSIDEALRQRFAEMAKQQGIDVNEMLASMKQTAIEEVASEVAARVVSAHAGQGVASQFATDAALLTDAERDYAISRARSDYRQRYAYLPESQRPAFTADAAATAVADAFEAKVRDRAQQMVLAADEQSDPSFQRGMEVAQQVTRKRLISNAWRQ